MNCINFYVDVINLCTCIHKMKSKIYIYNYFNIICIHVKILNKNTYINLKNFNYLFLDVQTILRFNINIIIKKI